LIAATQRPCRIAIRAQLAIRTQTAGGTSVTHYIHDIFGNVIAETAGDGVTGTTGTVREYIYLPEAEIAPTMQSAAQVDRPLGVVNAVNTTPVLWMFHVDHLNRPVRMTDAAKAAVWDAIWLPWGGVHAVTGMATLNARFPGQWFQTETGLHYNWHRSYDPTLGRYTQPDPLGFVDGPSVYAYAGGLPQTRVDPTGEFGVGGAIGGAAVNFSGQVAAQLYSNGGDLGQALRCVNFNNVVISGAAGFVGVTATEVLRKGKPLFDYARTTAASYYGKKSYDILVGGPSRIEKDSCKCKLSPLLQVLSTVLQ
jgi:RHS repeat-associated protein